MNFKKLVFPVLMAFGWLATNDVRAQTPPILQFTEMSDTVLTVTLGGQSVGTVLNTSPDHWEWHSGFFLGQTLDSFLGLIPPLQWTEPENDSEVNTVTFGLFQDLIPLELKTAQVGPEVGAVIVSDTPFLPGIPAFGNGQPGGIVQLPGLVAIPIFLDLGDNGGQVPDSGSTCALLLGASVALVGLSRVRSAGKA